jgi:hypothetical protein
VLASLSGEGVKPLIAEMRREAVDHPGRTAVTVDRDERKPTAGESKPSDHAPLIITLTADGR